MEYLAWSMILQWGSILDSKELPVPTGQRHGWKVVESDVKARSLKRFDDLFTLLIKEIYFLLLIFDTERSSHRFRTNLVTYHNLISLQSQLYFGM